MNVENMNALLAVFSDVDRVANYAKVSYGDDGSSGVITGDGDRLKTRGKRDPRGGGVDTFRISAECIAIGRIQAEIDRICHIWFMVA